MDTILEALRALKEDFEIIPLTDKEKEEWKNRKELLTKLAETEKGSNLEVTEDIIDIFKKALKEMEESGMPVGKVPNLKVTPLEDAVPVTGEDPEYDKLCAKSETQESLKEDLIIVEADKVKDKLYALKDEIEKAEGNLKFFLMDLFAVYMYHAFWGGVPTSSDERDELKAKGISTDELIHSDLTRKEWDELSEWEKGIDVEFKKE